MKIRMISLFCLGLLLHAPLSAQVRANEKNPFQTKSVSVFKNNSAFFIKTAHVKTKDKTFVMTDHLPRALFGTFWIHSENLENVTSYMDLVTSSHEKMPTSFVEIIQANKGKKMRVHVGEKDVYEGTALGVRVTNAKGDKIEQFNNILITFQTAKEWVTFAHGDIRRVEFLEKPNEVLEHETKTDKQVLAVHFRNEKAEQPLEMMYLSTGINWTPTYLIELTSDDEAQLSLRAEVVNHAEDIENTDMNFVVGIPNFSYVNRLSGLIDFLGLQYAYNNPYANQYNNMAGMKIYTDDVMETAVTLSGPSGTTLSQGVTGTADEDLYFYNVKNVTLKNNGRGHFPIFSEKIKVAHIYECNLEMNSINQGAYQKEFSFTPDNRNPVYHSLKINNDLKFPWTTGTAMVVSKKPGEDKRPISQDRLNYTPVDGQSYVKLTASPDIKVKHAEKEIGREQKVRQLNNNYFYDYVTIEGKIKVKSYKDKKVDLSLKRMIHGDLGTSNVTWKIDEQINRTGDINKNSNVCWETSIGGGEELEITYTYKVYIGRYY